jgi:hypothetical protein
LRHINLFGCTYIIDAEDLVYSFNQGTPTEGGRRFSTVDHLTKVACFVRKINKISTEKAVD